MTTLVELLITLSLDVGVRGRQFERVARWFLLNDPVQKAQFRDAWLWSEWDGAWGADSGIDIVARRHDGSLVAVQVKCYAPEYQVPKREIDSFLSESSRDVFKERLLIATCDLGRNARRTIEGQEKPVHTLLISDLEHSPVDWPTSPDRLRAWKPKPKSPRPHQREAIRNVVSGFESADRGQLIMACGTGKTLVGLWVAEEMESRRTLVLLPSLSLLAQTVREWNANDRRGFEFLAVCSDDSVVGEDEMVSHTADLPFTGVTTDPSDIAGFLRGRGPRVVFATYQSSPRVAEAQRLGRVPRFDLAIADEAHRCAGKVDASFGSILDGSVIQARKRLFATATPRIASGRLKRAAADFDLEIASMDDEARFGAVLHKLSFGEAIELDLLSDYQVVVMLVDDETVHDYVERGVFVEYEEGKVRDARTLASQIGLAKAMRKYDLKRVVTFHGRVQLAADFSRTLPHVIEWMPRSQRPTGRLWAEHVSGAMPTGKRTRLLGRLASSGRGEPSLLANARCLTEGVDVPTLDGVAFIDPRRSQVDVVQAVGRAIRKADAKEIGTIVLPLFVPSGADAEDELDRSTFEPVVQVLRALRGHDEQLGAELDELRLELGRTGILGALPARIRVIAPTSIHLDFVLALDSRIVQLTTRSWDEGIGALLRFVEGEGDALVPTGYVDEAGFRLGQWVNVQRTERKSGRLSVDRASRLDAIPGWSWDVRDTNWEVGYEELLSFVRENGHADVPFSHVCTSGFGLGSWVNGQRMRQRRDALTRARRESLESLPGWQWHALDARWYRNLACLARYAEEKGHSSPRVSETYMGVTIGTWVNSQRTRRGDGRLSAERASLLQALPGWTWDVRDAQWERNFQLLQRFVEREGHVRVPPGHVEDGVTLGRWVISLRSARGKARLKRFRPDRVERLESLSDSGWAWDAKADRWERNFAALGAYVEREGNALVPYGHTEDDLQLGWWVGNQRQFRRKGLLSKDRVARLESIDGWTWNAQDAHHPA